MKEAGMRIRVEPDTAWTMILAGLIYSQSRHAPIKPAY